MEAEAKSSYLKLKEETACVGTVFLKITQILMPLRVACAGGRTPLRDDSAAATDSDDDDVEAAGAQKRRKAPKLFSDYVFTSKLNKLIEVLKRVRDEDSTGKTITLFDERLSPLIWLLTHFKCISQKFGVFALWFYAEVVAGGASQAWVSVPHSLG